jgi:hypothetical protein
VTKSLLMGNVYHLCRVKTIITTVLTVMSSMDLHMISGNLGWVLVKFLVGFVEVGFFSMWVGHDETL